MHSTAPFQKPRLEVSDIINRYGEDHRRGRPLKPVQHKALNALGNCRTAVLGGHLQQCGECGHQRPAYNACRHRCCPKCQGLDNLRWVQERCDELLPVQYHHVVFTLPHELNLLAQYNPELIHTLLFHSAAETLQSFAEQRWNGRLGITGVLHTWGQKLEQHIHLHCIVTGGALTLDGQQWKSAPQDFLFRVEALGKAYRGRYCAKLLQAFDNGELLNPPGSLHCPDRRSLEHLIDHLHSKPWVVYSKPPFAGPEAVLKYLGRYTHRSAFSNRRLQSIDHGRITFTWKDYQHNGAEKTLSLSADEFLRRLLLHVPPKGFVRIRHYGLLAGRDRRAKLAHCRALFNLPPPPPKTRPSNADLLRRLSGRDPDICPRCGTGRLHTAAVLPNLLNAGRGPPRL